MKTIYALVSSSILIFTSTCAVAGSVTGLTTFSANTTARASEVNDNFTAVKSAVDDNDSRINTNTSDISTNASDIGANASDISTNVSNISGNTADITTNASAISTLQANSAGVKTAEAGGGVQITNSYAEYMSLSVTVPAAGNIIVFASGSVYLNVASASAQLIRVKVSDTSADVSETPGIQFIRSPNVSATGAANVYPYSIVKVFNVSASGTHTYYLNMWHQIGSATATAQTDDMTLTALYVPNTLP